jgi:hypothetical protein
MRGGNGRKLSGYYLEPGLKGVDPLPSHAKGRIPEGEYSASYLDQLHHKSASGNTIWALFALSDVPGFSSVDVHNGNNPSDSQACLLYGTKLGTDQVTESGAFRSLAEDFLGKVADDDGTDIELLTVHISIPFGNIDTFTPPEPFGPSDTPVVGAPPPGVGPGQWVGGMGDPNFHWEPAPPTPIQQKINQQGGRY